ncbi:unnamed protein product [Spirodela intermedia]|uniref:Uncharacterized protein n=1 Tax=Spirodela intermedia TaxID=51605 RepID=A0A7I8JGX0_SPIIN|nr:unnamed protein product [Spirodela intermedia]CAA6668652.1 unnamed protein product [Spirodela intermedia]
MRAFLRLRPPASAAATGSPASPSVSPPLTALRRVCSSGGGADPPPPDPHPAPPRRPWAKLNPEEPLCNSGHLHGGASSSSSLSSPPVSTSGADPPPPPPRRPWAKLNPEERLCNSSHLGGAASSSLTSPPASTGGADTPPSPPPQYLTPEEIAQVNRLLPNLCNSGHLREAVALLDASLLAGAPLDALPVAAVLRRLCGGGGDDELLRHDMTHSMALLNALLHNPRRHPAAAAAIAAMLVETYLELRRPREALKVFDWMRRPKSPCPPELRLWRAMVQGLCRYGRLLEALRVVKEMLVVTGAAAWVYWSLLNEARVREGLELDEALGGVCEVGDEEACERAVQVLDRIISNWRD